MLSESRVSSTRLPSTLLEGVEKERGMESESNFTFIDFDELQKKTDWDVEDVIWMLFGDHGLTAINSFRSDIPHEERRHPDYRVTSLYDDFLKALLSGRFGKIRKNYEKDALRFYPVHPLKVIDWIDDEKNLGRLGSHDDLEPHPDLSKLIESWNSDRESEDQSVEWSEINLEELAGHLAKEDFWGRGEFRRLLFTQTYAHEYPLAMYHKYDPEIEAMMREVDHRIDEGLEAGRIKLTDSGLGFGNALLVEIRFKGCPVPDGLIEARERGDWDKTEKLLKKLQGNMRIYVQCGGKIDKAELELIKEEQPPIEPAHAPNIGSQEGAKMGKPETSGNSRGGLMFYRAGKTWRVGFEEIKNVPNTKGMLYIQHLLINSQEYFTGLEIQALDGVDASSISNPGIARDTAGLNDDEPHQKEDESSFISKNNLLEMRNAYEVAEENNQPDAGLLKEEYEETLKSFQSLHDIHGKPRDDTTPQKRATKAVAKNIKTAKDNILEVIPELSELLEDIKTGNSYGYIPSNPDSPVKIITQQAK